MAYQKSKYNVILNGEISTAAFEALLDNPDKSLTIDEIINAKSFVLNGISNQKMAKILNDLVAKGMVEKGEMRNRKITYKAVGRAI